MYEYFLFMQGPAYEMLESYTKGSEAKYTYWQNLMLSSDSAIFFIKIYC